MMAQNKTLVVFYSLDGNTKLIAEAIAHEIDADILELKLEKEIGKGFTKYFWGGRQVMQKQKPALKPFEKNPHKYDYLVIGTPVWAWTFTPAIRSFLAQTKLKNKKIALFCCHGGGPAKTLDNLAQELDGNEIIAKNDFEEPKRKNTQEQLKKAKLWAQEIKKQLKK